MIFVGPTGAKENSGHRNAPVASIQEAFNRAQPGDTVHVLPGDYAEAVRTRRSGNPDAPITLTGPPDAVFRGRPTPEKHKSGFHIEHSHIHIRGLTFNGLFDPTAPESVESYIRTPITARLTPSSPDEYLQNLVIKPHAVGNSLRPLVHVTYSEHVEIGEFKIIGPPGLAIGKFGDKDAHNGEIVYIGTAPGLVPKEGEGPSYLKDFEYEPDRTNDVHVHHIDNSPGHPHAELVDVKAGCHDVSIEYCTDAGGAGSYIEPDRDQDEGSAIRLGGREVTVRWNRIEGSNGSGIKIGNWGLTNPEGFKQQNGRPYQDSLQDHAQANEIFGNRIANCANLAIKYLLVHPDVGETHTADNYGPDDQSRVCGNTIIGETHGDPTSACGDSVPSSETIGHLGGDSPWTD